MQEIVTRGSRYVTSGKLYASIGALSADAKEVAAYFGRPVIVDRMADGQYRLLVAAVGTEAFVRKTDRASELASTTAVVGKLVTFGATVGEVEPAFNTADQYAETVEAQDDRDWAMSRQAVREQETLDAQLERDAAYYSATRMGKVSANFDGPDAFSDAKKLAKEKRGSMKRTSDGWTVTWTAKVLVAREGDAAYRAPKHVPGLLHGQRDDAEDHGGCDCPRCDADRARNEFMAQELRG